MTVAAITDTMAQIYRNANSGVGCGVRAAF
jgi:hypothetical protein